VSIAVFDTSALVKLVVSEPGFERVGEYWMASDTPVCCRLAHVEAHAALAAARRQRRFDAYQLITAKRRLNALWQQVTVVEVDEPLVLHGVDLVQRYPLKGYDAVHVAAALAAGAIAFITGDKTQARAAASENLKAVEV
jgi:hypothetical protein